MINENSDSNFAEVRWHKGNIALVCFVALGLACVAGIARWMENYSSPVDADFQSEELYLSPDITKRLSLGFNGLAADWYWMRSLQYVGRKVLNHQGIIQLDDLNSLNLKLLASLLEHTTTLDPQFMAAYEYSAMVLPEVDREAAIKIIQKGIAANPQTWRLYHHLGYIFWQSNRFAEARQTYEAGARVADAPRWMRSMAARMEAEGGSRDTAREMYRRIFAEANDQQVKDLALKRLLWLQSLDEREAIDRLLINFRAQKNRCPEAWAVLTRELRAINLRLDRSGAPLDPTDVPYVLASDSCSVELDASSSIPRR